MSAGIPSYRHCSHGFHPEVDLSQKVTNWNQEQERGKPINPESIDKLYRMYRNPGIEPITTVPLSPSSNSPAYYDPLHLNKPHVDSHYNRKGFGVIPADEHTDGSSSDSSHRIRGILKTSKLSKSEQNIAFQEKAEHKTPSNAQKRFATRDLIASVNCHGPLGTSGFQPIDPHATQYSSLNDPSRISAFTPVKSGHKFSASLGNLTSIGSPNFIPEKAPPVLDFVASSATKSGLYSPSIPCESRQRLYVKQHQHNHVHPPVYHCSPNAPIHYPTPQYFSEHHQFDCNSAKHPIPAPRRAVKKLTQDLDSISIYRGSSDGSCVSGTSSSQIDVLTNEAVRLRSFLATTSSKDLKKFLCDQLESKNPTLIRALSTLIPESIAKQTESHCVRCHKVG